MTSEVIQFVYQNQIMQIRNPNPNETLLNYIRTTLKKTGTKEGCGSGDCGACSVVIGELKDKKINYKVINSCISFLATINGKQLIIVEDLVDKNGSLHPVQESMVRHHGSQCGFCTPGFVMSMFAMFKNQKNFNNSVIKESIAGNLCRCTGYKPIVKAAKSLNGKNRKDQFEKNKENTIKLLKKINSSSIAIYNKGKKYFAPIYVNELKKILKKYPDIKLISGQTDIALEVTQKRKDIDSMVYMNSINELNYIRREKNFIEVGAATTLIDFQLYIQKYYKDFKKILLRYGSLGIRNVGTLAANLANASPIGDNPPLLLALDSKVVISGIKKTRVIPLNDFFVGYRKTKLKSGEFIYAVRIPLFANNIYKAYKVSNRFDDDISSVCAAFNIELKNKKVKFFRAAYGGMAEIPKRATNCEKVLLNSPFTEEFINKAKIALQKDFRPISDVRNSSKYRMEVAQNLLQKCFLEINEKKVIETNA
tara:strand:+ start:810 stop:2249 length:1440 start_codon:yes stop_codon:yes gene_type:complete